MAGPRLSLPDSLPIIVGSVHPNVLYAFGHQHLGMTLGSVTGELIADLVADRPPRFDLDGCRADLF